MPVDRSLAEGLADTLTGLYRDAETRLAQNLARRIRTDITTSSDNRLTALASLRRQSEAVLTELSGRHAAEAERALMTAYARGAAAAVDEMARLSGERWVDWLARRSRVAAAITRLLGIARRREMRLAEAVAALRADLPGIDSIMVLARELTQRMSSTHLHVLRWQDDTYREVMGQPVFDVLAGTKTRLRAAQVAWEDLLSKGVAGFTDRRGRNWELASYVEMATRTAVAQAGIEGHLDRITQAGGDLVIVSNPPEECERCRPWEGEVLAIHGPTGPRELEHATIDFRFITVDVKATVGEAVLAGLFHPNCRHRIAMYLPGVTKAPTHTADPDGDKARQKLRRLERELRALKRQEAAVVDPAARAAFGKKIRAKQAQIRAHVAATGPQRQPQREHIGSAR